MTERCCAANDSMFLLPSRSVSPNAYCARSVENKMRASSNVIHPRSSGGNADKERASAASAVPSSFLSPDGTAASAPNSHLMKLTIPILECAGEITRPLPSNDNTTSRLARARYSSFGWCDGVIVFQRELHQVVAVATYCGRNRMLTDLSICLAKCDYVPAGLWWRLF